MEKKDVLQQANETKEVIESHTKNEEKIEAKIEVLVEENKVEAKVEESVSQDIEQRKNAFKRKGLNRSLTQKKSPGLLRRTNSMEEDSTFLISNSDEKAETNELHKAFSTTNIEELPKPEK